MDGATRLACGLCLLSFVPCLLAEPPSTLEDKVKSVLPSAEEERWLQVGWRTDLMQARAEAQRLGKPLFLWVMDGHPLGCV